MPCLPRKGKRDVASVTPAAAALRERSEPPESLSAVSAMPGKVLQFQVESWPFWLVKPADANGLGSTAVSGTGTVQQSVPT